MSDSRSFELRLVDTAHARLACVVRGVAAGPPLLILQPLFEEANRLRRLHSVLGQLLAQAGIASWMPDLPGCGESPGDADFAVWQASIAALVAQVQPSGVFAVRGGALLAPNGLPRLLYAPVASGTTLLRDLMRAQAVSDRERGLPGRVGDYEASLAAGRSVELTGYTLTPALAGALATARMPDDGQSCVVAAGAEGVAGPPLWRQAEPEACEPLAEALAAHITSWVAR